MLRALWLQFSRGNRLPGRVLFGEQRKIVSLERDLTGQQFIGQAGQRVLIAERSSRTCKLLGSHVEGGKG